MKTINEEALEAIALLPDNSEIDDIMYRLFVLDKINQGKRDVAEGRVLSTAELKEEMNQW